MNKYLAYALAFLGITTLLIAPIWLHYYLLEIVSMPAEYVGAQTMMLYVCLIFAAAACAIPQIKG